MELPFEIERILPVDSRRKTVLSSIVAVAGDRLKINGDLNYLLYKFMVNLRDYEEKEYACSILRGVVSILRENTLAPYEDTKIKENGDVE